MVQQTVTLPKSLLRVDEVATYLNVTDRTVRSWIKHGDISAVKIVGTVRISWESLEKYLDSKGKR
jgi:excisionase family DNA binding protein